MDQIQFSIKRSRIVIEIPLDIIESAADGHSNTIGKVTNKKLLGQEVLFQLENNLGYPESGLTGLQELLDEAIMEVYESGSDAFDWDD